MSHILHKALVTYVLAAMQTFFPTRSRATEYRAVAEAIVQATPDPEDEVQLAAIASLESGYATNARGRLGEIGAWQLMPWRPVPRTLAGQAKEALWRWKAQGRCGYTGEAGRKDGKCPLADNRYLRALLYSREHPFVPPEGTELAER